MKNHMYQPTIIKKELDDEHFYYVNGKFVPSVTKILEQAMPMPIGLRMWLGEVGNEKAEQRLNQAAARGSMIHDTCEALLLGSKIELQATFPKRADQKCIVAFMQWVNDFQPEFEDRNR